MTNEEQAKTMTKTLPNQSRTFSNRTYFTRLYTGQKIFTIEFEDDVTNEDRLMIIENVSALPDIKESNLAQQAEIDRLQAKITEFAGIILDYETKFDILAENEAKRCIGFGEAVKLKCAKRAHKCQFGREFECVSMINIKRIYTNFKKP